MMVRYLLFLFFSWVFTACVIADSPLNPIKTEDLKSIIDSVQKDVARHLKMAYAGRRLEFASSTMAKNSMESRNEMENGKEFRNFMKMIENSMHNHLIKNLGPPSSEYDSGHSKDAGEDLSKESSTQMYEIRVGSTKGMPGVNFPDYTDIPITSFTCEEKTHLPGFYADLDTGCQVFHVCWPDRRESFLCPMGTTFNQALKACDYWYNSNCSLAPYYYTVNAELKPEDPSEPKTESVSSMITTLLENTDSDATEKPDSSTYGPATSDSVMSFISELTPVKAKIVVYPKTATQRLKVVATASVGKGKKSDFKQKPRQRNSNTTSKHVTVPRSLENSESTKDATIKFPQNLPTERIYFLLLEAFDRAIIDIEKNETWSMYTEYAKKAAENIKSLFTSYVGEPLEHFDPEPGSEMYKEDMDMKEIMKDEMWKKILLVMAILMETFDLSEKKIPLEREDLKPEPLTNLNPRFVTKPAAEAELQNEFPVPVNRVKRSETTSDPAKFFREDGLNIHKATKKLLLKNYMKLFKTKHKHA